MEKFHILQQIMHNKIVEMSYTTKKKKIWHQATPDLHNIENEQKNYLVIATKYFVTLQNRSGFVIVNTHCLSLLGVIVYDSVG